MSGKTPVITESQFYRIAGACDRVLRHPGAEVAWMAIPWLHVLSQHPIHLAWYADLFDEPQGGERGGTRKGGLDRGRAYAARMAKLGRSFVRAASRMVNGRTGAGEGGPGGLLTAPVAKTDVIILSWLVHVDHLQEEEDFYFGNLQSLLRERGLSSLLLLRNQSGVPATGLMERAMRKGPCSRMILPDAHAIGQEVALLVRCIRARARLRRLLREECLPLDRRVVRRACREQVTEETIGNLRLHGQIMALCRQTNPGMAVGMYEGHAWERCAWHAVRSSLGESGVCVGYQHTTLRRHAHAAKRSIGTGRGYDPDIILTLGDATRRTLMSCRELEGTDVITFGTHRRGGGRSVEAASEPGSTCLVIPEGIPSECIYLFEFALECARRLPGTRFVFRTHPVLPFDRVRGKLKGYGEGLRNVEISRHSDIDDDFARSSSVLYRGSSAVFYGVLRGLKPFYVSRSGEMDIDPLYEVSGWRVHVFSADDFVDKYRSHQSGPPGQRQAEWKSARDYCLEYALPAREKAVDSLLQAVGRRKRAMESHG